MKILGITFSIIILFCTLSGCTTDSTSTYSAGIAGPKLAQPLVTQHILVLSSLADIKVNLISENIFTYQNLGSTIIPAPLINAELSKRTATNLKNLNFQSVDSAAINGNNVLNTTEIQSAPDQLTRQAKKFLAKQLRNHDIDTLILITQNGAQPLIFDLKCELSKTHTYYQASIEPHLYLYKIYIINAHTLRILTWSTGSANGSLRNTHLCKPPAHFNAENLNELNEILTSGLTSAVTADITRTFTPS